MIPSAFAWHRAGELSQMNYDDLMVLLAMALVVALICWAVETWRGDE